MRQGTPKPSAPMALGMRARRYLRAAEEVELTLLCLKAHSSTKGYTTKKATGAFSCQPERGQRAGCTAAGALRRLMAWATGTDCCGPRVAADKRPRRDTLRDCAGYIAAEQSLPGQGRYTPAPHASWPTVLADCVARNAAE